MAGVVAIPRVELVGTPKTVREPASELQSSWNYNCYSSGQPCSGNTGNTKGGGSNTVGCSPISGNGCSQYSFNGGGEYKLCMYSDNGCSDLIESVNGGVVSCIVLGTAPHSWKTIIRDNNC